MHLWELTNRSGTKVVVNFNNVLKLEAAQGIRGGTIISLIGGESVCIQEQYSWMVERMEEMVWLGN